MAGNDETGENEDSRKEIDERESGPDRTKQYAAKLAAPCQAIFTL